MDWGGASLGQGEGARETLVPSSAVHPRPLLAGLRGASGGAHKERLLDSPPPPAPLPFCPLSPSYGRSRDQALQLAGEVGREGGGASVQVPGHGPVPFLGGCWGSLCWDRGAGRQTPQASRPLCATLLCGSPAPTPMLPSSHSPYPPDPHPKGALRSHTSFRPCPGARQPLAHPWTAPRLLCPPRLPPPHPRRQ